MADLRADLKWEKLFLDISFTSLAIHQLFMKHVSGKNSITINSMDTSGSFRGEIIMK